MRSKLIGIGAVRGVILNGVLLLLFACAWVSDRWPELTTPAISVAVVIVLCEAFLLYCASRGRDQNDTTAAAAAAAGITITPAQ